MDLRLPEDQLHALIAEGRWRQVADELADWPEPWAARLRRLARNLALLADHRPDVHQRLMATAIPDGLTDASAVDDRAALQGFAELREPWSNGQAVAVLGIGDGATLATLARHPPELMHQREQPIYLIDPDAAQLWPALAALDLSAAIEQPRVMWYVGDGCYDRLLADLVAQPTLPFPLVQSFGSVAGPTHGPELERVLRGVAASDQRRQQELGEHYAQVEPGQVCDLLGTGPRRQPRVLLLTSRFTSVLQYSARDTAEAFAQLGWDARVAIEPRPWHVMSRTAIHAEMAAFKPDLVFQLDHLRAEQGPAAPTSIPWVCWIQDHLPNLVNDRAGASVTDTEFVLTATPSVYVDRYGYPKRSVVAIHKLTKVPQRPESWTSDGEDVVFVSTASRGADQIIEQNLQHFGGTPAEAEAFRRAQRKVVEIYERGGSMGTAAELAELIDDAPGISRTAREAMLRMMVHPLNDALYRQQALEWVVDIADDLKISVGLYGRGWDANPRFARHARGPVQYGAPLEALTRCSKINLQITPNACLHQRLLDGLVAGGFFLVRKHVTDDLFPELASFVRMNLPDDVDRLDDARRVLAPALRAPFEGLMARATRVMSVLGEEIDPVAQIRAAIEAQSFDDAGNFLPRLDEVSFDTREALKARIEAFVSNAGARASVAREQRESVERRRTYVAGVRQMLRTIRERMARSMAGSEVSREVELRHRDAQPDRRVA